MRGEAELCLSLKVSTERSCALRCGTNLKDLACETIPGDFNAQRSARKNSPLRSEANESFWVLRRDHHVENRLRRQLLEHRRHSFAERGEPRPEPKRMLPWSKVLGNENLLFGPLGVLEVNFAKLVTQLNRRKKNATNYPERASCRKDSRLIQDVHESLHETSKKKEKTLQKQKTDTLCLEKQPDRLSLQAGCSDKQSC